MLNIFLFYFLLLDVMVINLNRMLYPKTYLTRPKDVTIFVLFLNFVFGSYVESP